VSNQQNNNQVKLTNYPVSFSIFLHSQEPELEPDSEKWPNIRPEPDTTRYPVHPYSVTKNVSQKEQQTGHLCHNMAALALEHDCRAQAVLDHARPA